MTAIVSSSTEIIYPTSDGEPVAETYDHLYALITTLEVLKQYLQGQRATVLANQFLYYAQGMPKLRVAPDVMVIFEVEPGGRDSYKIWEEGQVPRVIFEMTSKSTQSHDTSFKKELYAQLEVQEYWLFDPKHEWIEGQLQGYQLQGEKYVPIVDRQSTVLKLRLEVEGKVLGFYRQDNGEKLLLPEELAATVQTEVQRRIAAEAEAEQERQRAEQERQKAAALEAQLARYREQFGDLPE
jgi:Uma2 family endonuclease